jgi:hypothetical protein
VKGSYVSFSLYVGVAYLLSGTEIRYEGHAAVDPTANFFFRWLNHIDY